MLRPRPQLWPRTFCLALVVLLGGGAPARGDEPLAPDRQRTFDRGLVAARAGEFKLAVRYFAEVHEASPGHEQTIYNLGLAHGRAGHEIAAIAWWEAYLALAPESANAPAVRTEIDRLETVARDKVSRIFGLATQMAGSVTYSEAWHRAHAYAGIAHAQGGAGRPEDALATLALAGNSIAPSDGDYVWVHYVYHLTNQGDYAQARATVAKIVSPIARAGPQKRLCEALVQAGDLDTARAVVAEIEDPGGFAEADRLVRMAALNRMLDEQLAAGDFDEGVMQELLPLLKEEEWTTEKSGLYARYAQAQFAAGHPESAMATMRRAPSRRVRAQVWADFARQLLDRGDTRMARLVLKDMLAIVPDMRQPSELPGLGWIARTAAMLGGAAEARGVARQILTVPVESALLASFADVLALAQLLNNQRAAAFERAAWLKGQMTFDPYAADRIFGYAAYLDVLANKPKEAVKAADQAAKVLHDPTKSWDSPARRKAIVLLHAAEAWIDRGELDQAFQLLVTDAQIDEAYPYTQLERLRNIRIQRGETSAALDAALANIIPAFHSGEGEVVANFFVAWATPENLAGADGQKLRGAFPQLLRTALQTNNPRALPAVARLQERLGDPAGARLTQARAHYVKWLEVAKQYSGLDEVVNLEEALSDYSFNRSAGTLTKNPVDLIRNSSEQARLLSNHLDTIDRIRRELREG